MEIFEKLELAKRQLTSGDLKLAEASSRQILQSEADQPDALHLLGLVYHQSGQSDIAVAFVLILFVLSAKEEK